MYSIASCLSSPFLHDLSVLLWLLNPPSPTPMPSNAFRRLALSFPEPSEQAHMDHPDFRVAGKIFATLGYPEGGWARVKLTALEREMVVKAQPTALHSCTGVCG